MSITFGLLLGAVCFTTLAYCIHQFGKMEDLEDEAFEIMAEYIDIEELHFADRNDDKIMEEVVNSYSFFKRFLNLKAQTVDDMFPNILNRLDLHILAAQDLSDPYRFSHQ